MKRYPDLSLVRKILVVKLRHHGDVLLSTPVLSALKKAMLESQIDAYIYKDTHPMIEGHPGVSRIYLYDKKWKELSFFKRLKKEIGLLKEIRKEKYDLVINLTEGDRGALVCSISGAKYRVGFDPQGSGMWQKKRMYTHVTKICPHPRHAVERNLDVLRTIGIFPTEEEKNLYFHISDEAKVEIEGEFILMHPVSRWLFKSWPPKKCAELITLLHRDGKRIAITSGPDPEELKFIDDILQEIPHIPIMNFAGKISLKQLGALIAKSSLLITVDSVPFHMASALKAPVVAIFGPTSELNWGPWKNPHAKIVVQSHFSCRPCYQPGCGGSYKSDCLETLSVSQVYQTVLLTLLDNAKAFQV